MMIDPETYYELFLKGKTREEIHKIIGSLKRKIRQLQKEMDNPNPDGCIICPGPEVQLFMYREYLKRAAKAYMDLDTVEKF